jgi:hypothetical protein
MAREKSKWAPNNVAEYFFFDEYGFLSINEKKIRDCYNEFTSVMNSIYENVKKTYNLIADRALTNEDFMRQADYPFEIESKIAMKGLEYYFDKDRHDAEQ